MKLYPERCVWKERVGLDGVASVQYLLGKLESLRARSRRDGSVVRSTCYWFRGPGVDCQHPHGGS